MKLNAIALATACSLLCVAFCQSIEARTIRADNGTTINQGDWNAGTPSSIGGNLSLNTGLTNYVSYTYLPGSSGLTDAFSEPGGLAIAGASTMYNYWSSSQSYSNNPQLPQDQIMVYTLGYNDPSTLSFGLASKPSLFDDIEIDFNYGNTAAASFQFGGVTYAAPANSTPNANFLFSSTFGFLGLLNDYVDPNNSLNDVANVSFTPFQQGMTTLEGWTISGGAAAAPEIDSSSLVTALTLLAGALVIVRGQYEIPSDRKRLVTHT